MSINLWAVLGCGIFSMVLGFVWYGPLFGKKWMEVIGADALDAAERKKMQQRAGPLYLLQFLLTLFQAFVASGFIYEFRDGSLKTPLQLMLMLWGGFVVPITAANAMWNNESKKKSWTRFLLSAGYQLVLNLAFGLILFLWV